MQTSSITSNSPIHPSHYEIIFGDNYLKVIANAESHSLAMQAVQTIKAELGDRYRSHKQETHPAQPVEGGEPPGPALSIEAARAADPPPPPPPPTPVREKLRFYADAHIRNMETGQVVRTSLTETRWTLSVFEDLIGNKLSPPRNLDPGITGGLRAN